MKKILSVFVTVIMAFMCITISGCDSKGDTNKFVGNYVSVFVDSQNDYNSSDYWLKINSDNTFSLGGRINYQGTWKSYTISGKTQLLCMADDSYIYNATYPYAWNPYFTLVFLDDGTLMATSGMTNNMSGVVSAFGSSVTTVTLVLFEKE
ncbi:MAG: hypothetical protein E7343_02145 [Clostridiales bacterium]|nr:hypothetical protein [Clostridiales bacterium]